MATYFQWLKADYGFTRRAGQALHLQPAALPRRQEAAPAGLRHLRAVRDREAGRLQAEGLPARRRRLQHLLDDDRDAPRAGREEARRWCSASSMPRSSAGTTISTATTRPPTTLIKQRQSRDDRRADRLLDRQDEGVRHRRFRRRADARHRRHDRRAHEEFLRQDGARRRRQAEASTTRKAYTLQFVNKKRRARSAAEASERQPMSPRALACRAARLRCAASARRSPTARGARTASTSTSAPASSCRCSARRAAASRRRCG